jgi:hypothetical protein
MEPRIKSAFSCFSASIFQSRATPPPRSHLGDLPPPAAPAHRSSKDEVAAPVVGTNSSRLAVYLASTSLEPKQRARRREDMEFRTAPGHGLLRRFSHAKLNTGRGIRAQAGAFQNPAWIRRGWLLGRLTVRL